MCEEFKEINKENVCERAWVDSFPLCEGVTIEDVFVYMIQNGRMEVFDYLIYKSGEITAYDLLKKSFGDRLVIQG